MTKLWLKQKYEFKKKRITSPLKPNIFSLQNFPQLSTTIKPNNHSKQGFYTKRGIPNPQTSIHTKIHNKIHTKSMQKFLTSSIPLLFFSPSFFLLLFSCCCCCCSSSSSPSLLFSLIRFSLSQRPKNEISLKPCLALS